MLVVLLTSRQVSSTNLKLARSEDLAKLCKKTIVVKESIFILFLEPTAPGNSFQWF